MPTPPPTPSPLRRRLGHLRTTLSLLYALTLLPSLLLAIPTLLTQTRRTRRA